MNILIIFDCNDASLIVLRLNVLKIKEILYGRRNRPNINQSFAKLLIIMICLKKEDFLPRNKPIFRIFLKCFLSYLYLVGHIITNYTIASLLSIVKQL